MKETIKQNILNYYETTNIIEEAIYLIDGIYISGDFDCGYRGLDHNALLDDDYTWTDLLENGTVIVPETNTYISDQEVEELNELNYKRLPLNNNHIVGFKN